MIYLTGCAAEVAAQVAATRGDLGMLAQPDGHSHVDPRFPVWAADNGCYAAGDRFDLDRWLVWLDRHRPKVSTCLFAAAPDVVGDAAATLDRSLPVLPMVRDLGYPAALVAQDGLERLTVPWDTFDALFIGGSTEWKLSEHAARLADEARSRGKWAHMGRVNSGRRLRGAASAGYDSADGTFIAFGPTVNLPRVLAWLDGLHRSPALFLPAG